MHEAYPSLAYRIEVEVMHNNAKVVLGDLVTVRDQLRAGHAIHWEQGVLPPNALAGQCLPSLGALF